MQEPVYFLKIELENILCFGARGILDLSDGKGGWKKWNIILGNNGTGKTSLLQAIALFELEITSLAPNFKTLLTGPQMQNIYSFDEGYFSEGNIEKNAKHIHATLSRPVNGQKIDNNVLSITIKNNGVINTSSVVIEDEVELKIFGYGANRIMDYANGSPNAAFRADSETLFSDNARLINAEEWLLNMDYVASKESEIKEFAEKEKRSSKTNIT